MAGALGTSVRPPFAHPIIESAWVAAGCQDSLRRANPDIANLQHHGPWITRRDHSGCVARQAENVLPRPQPNALGDRRAGRIHAVGLGDSGSAELCGTALSVAGNQLGLE